MAAVAVLALPRRPAADAQNLPVTTAPGSLAMPAASSDVPTPSGAESHPLDISMQLTDARKRAGLDFDTPVLIGVRLIIEAGRPLGPLEFTYARVEGRSLPGRSVTGPRTRISYDGAQARQAADPDRSPARTLPDPNCPLEAAFRAAVQAGAPAEARYFAVYSHSARHERPVWSLTAASGQSRHIDADNCAVLVR